MGGPQLAMEYPFAVWYAMAALSSGKSGRFTSLARSSKFRSMMVLRFGFVNRKRGPTRGAGEASLERSIGGGESGGNSDSCSEGKDE